MPPDIASSQSEQIQPESLPSTKFIHRPFVKLFAAIFLFVFFATITASLVFYVANQPPAEFPLQAPIVITPGTGVAAITEQLKNTGVVRSQQLLYYVLLFLHDPADLKASTYVFEEPLDTLAIAKRLTEGDFDTNLVSLTFIEGESAAAFARRAAQVLPDFDSEEFLQLTSNLEGQLFPDTYRVPADFSSTALVELLVENHAEVMKSYEVTIQDRGLSDYEVVTLASVVEREANTDESMRMVAGILLNRLEIGMPLQADATIEYVLETPLGKLPPGQLAQELREIDSPYNTYTHNGLPPTPIGNPGEAAISAVVFPAETDYFYYLTDNTGEFHYAKTYDQHRQNIARYLR